MAKINATGSRTMDHTHHSTAMPKAAATSGTRHTCPMHPEIVHHASGSCPKCGMTLIPIIEGRDGRRWHQRCTGAAAEFGVGGQQRVAFEARQAMMHANTLHMKINPKSQIKLDTK